MWKIIRISWCFYEHNLNYMNFLSDDKFLVFTIESCNFEIWINTYSVTSCLINIFSQEYGFWIFSMLSFCKTREKTNSNFKLTKSKWFLRREKCSDECFTKPAVGSRALDGFHLIYSLNFYFSKVYVSMQFPSTNRSVISMLAVPIFGSQKILFMVLHLRSVCWGYHLI